MEEENTRPPQKAQQFRNLTEAERAMLDRLRLDRTDPKSGDRLANLDTTPVAHVFRRTIRDASDIRNIFQVMPDLNLPRDILVSAITSPGDLAKTRLIFSHRLDTADSSLTAPMMRVIEKFFKEEKELESKVANWIDDALIMSGAHPIMIIPESSIDAMINGPTQQVSLESIARYDGEVEGGWFKPKGWLGLRLSTGRKEDYVSFESARNHLQGTDMVRHHTIKIAKDKGGVDLPIRVTDNPAVLRTPAIQNIKRARIISQAYGSPSFESRRAQRAADKGKKVSNSDVYSKFFKSPQGLKRSRLEVVTTSKQNGRGNLGHPLEYHLSTDSVVPISIPGDEGNHVGYIVILDNNGFPVSYSRRHNYYDEIRRLGSSGADSNGGANAIAGELLNIAKETMVGGLSGLSDQQIDRLAGLHSQVIEADLVSRLKTGMMGGDFEITYPDHINRLMLARTLKNQLTTLLYVPAELMIYIAYDYNEFGVGKSILEDAKSLAAMRATVSIANVIGATKNAIPGKDINIELDPDLQDPVEAATFMANEAMGLAYHQFPMSVSSAQSIAEQLQMSSFSLNVTGNPRYPEIKTSITPRESSKVEIDTELQKSLRDDLVRLFSVTPEMIDGMNQADFATTVVQNNLMLLKRVMLIQGITNPYITDYIRVFSYNSSNILEELLEIVEKNTKLLPDEYKEEPESFVYEFLNSLDIKLPEPEIDVLEQELELFDKFKNALDNILPAFIAEEYFDGYSADIIKDALPTIIAAKRGMILRKWMRKRGIFRDIDVYSSKDDGSPAIKLADEMANHVDILMEMVGEYAKKVANDARKRKGLNAIVIKEDEKTKNALTPDEPEEEEEGGNSADADSDETLDDVDNSDDDGSPEADEDEDDGEPNEEETPEESDTDSDEGKEDGKDKTEDDDDDIDLDFKI